MDVAAISSLASLAVILIGGTVAIAKYHAKEEVSRKQAELNHQATEKTEAVLLAEIREVKVMQRMQNEKMDARMRDVEKSVAALQAEVRRNGNGGR